MSRPRRPRLRFIESDESATSCSSFSTNCGTTSVPSTNPVSQMSAMRPSMITLVSSIAIAACAAWPGETARRGAAARAIRPAAADHEPEVRQRQQDQAVQEHDARVPDIGPVHRGADRLGRGQPDRAAEQRAQQVRHRQIAQAGFDADDDEPHGKADRRVDDGAAGDRVQLRGRIDEGRDEDDAARASARPLSHSGEPEARDAGRMGTRYEPPLVKIKKQHIQRLADTADPDQFAAGRAPGRVGGIDVGGRHHDARESHLCRLTDAQRRLRDTAHLPAEPDFPENGRLAAPGRDCGRSTPRPPRR